MKTLAIALGLLALGACSNGNNDNDDDGPSGNSLVQNLIQDNTTDSAEPIEINDLDLQFSEDPDAFGGFFQ